MRAAIACALILLLTGCIMGKRPSEEQCEKTCLHRSKLYIDHQWANKIANAPVSEHERLKNQQAAEWQDVQTNPNRGLQACVVACTRPGRQTMVDCILGAKTFEQAQACEQ